MRQVDTVTDATGRGGSILLGRRFQTGSFLFPFRALDAVLVITIFNITIFTIRITALMLFQSPTQEVEMLLLIERRLLAILRGDSKAKHGENRCTRSCR